MLLIFGAAQAEAALQKYALHRTGISQADDSDPDLSSRCFAPWIHPGDACEGKALIEVSGPAPILRDFEFVEDTTRTILIPSIVVSLFLSIRTSEGPTGLTTGSGGTTSGSSLRWGSVTGWTITGSRWCNIGSLSFICTLAGFMIKETTDPPLWSDFYDLGTWSFHGTGFSSVPFVSLAFTNSFGNHSLAYRGALVSDATIPALPALGVIALGALLAGGAASALRRSVQDEP